MLSMEKHLEIREAYYLDKKSMRAIARETGYSRTTVRKAVEQSEAFTYQRKKPAPAPVLADYKERLQELVEANRRLPRKQRYTSRKMYEIIRKEGYKGAESTVRRYVSQVKKTVRKKKVYIPLEYDPGVDMQMDWGEAQVIMKGGQMTIHLFVLRWCYSRKLFVAAYPSARQECFIDGHVRAFHYFGGMPQRIIYDNLKTAVKQIMAGRNRKEQAYFKAFKLHYVLQSQYCNPNSGHEKGGVESDVGFSQRNFLAGVPAFESFEELNDYLLQECDRVNQRKIAGMSLSIPELWEEERLHIRSLPEHDYPCCVTREATLNQYSQVTYHTNRYSVPTEQAYPRVTIRAYPFKLEILYQDKILATHPRRYDRDQYILDPLHYLPLLEQRPGAFEHAKPIREWRETWDPVYEVLLEHLRTRLPDRRAIREFLRILQLHQSHPGGQVTTAIRQALHCGCAHFDSVSLCLNQESHSPHLPAQLDLSDHPVLAEVGQQPLDLLAYDQLLDGGYHD